jgi:hypothetical protein
VKDTNSWNVTSCTMIVQNTEKCTAPIFRVVKCRRRDGELWFMHLIMKEKKKNRLFLTGNFSDRQMLPS